MPRALYVSGTDFEISIWDLQYSPENSGDERTFKKMEDFSWFYMLYENITVVEWNIL